MPSRPHITVCICTYQRPALLLRLLEKLREQTTSVESPTSDFRPPTSDAQASSDLRPPTSDFRFTLSVVIADNDATESARSTVETFAASAPFPVKYCVEPRKNIALVRNHAIAHATGDYIACLDDDEFPA